MKILFVLSSNKFSGAENVVCQIAHFLQQQAQFYYCSPFGDIETSLLDKNVVFKGVKKLNVKNLKRIIKEIRPDVIHANDVKASFISMLACKKIPLICHLHNNEQIIRRLSIKSLCFLLACKKAKKAIFVSNTNYQSYYFKKAIKQKAIVLRNVISSDDIINKANVDIYDENYDVAFLGRLGEPKNPLRMVKIMCDYVDQTGGNCVVIGDGNLKQECVQYVADKGCLSHINFMGFQKNPYKILKNCKSMIMSSVYEGTPMCALEAYCLGVPIVSTKTDLAEMIIGGKTGYVYDQDEDAVKYLKEVTSNREFYKNNCLEYFKKINNEKEYANKMLQIYKEAK